MKICSIIIKWLTQAIRELEEQVMGSDSDAVVVPGDFVIDRHSHHISLTPRGMLRVLQKLGEMLEQLWATYMTMLAWCAVHIVA